MAIIMSQKSSVTQHPSSDDEKIRAVIVDYTPDKEVDHPEYGKRTVCQIVYETEIEDESGQRYTVFSKPYTSNKFVENKKTGEWGWVKADMFNDKANFYKDFKQIYGREPTNTELRHGFDTDNLIGVGVKLIIGDEFSKDGKTRYAKITYISHDAKTPLEPSGEYVPQLPGAPVADKPAMATAAKNFDPLEVVVHIGKNKGKTLGDMETEAIQALVKHWLPSAKESGDREDELLVRALTALASEVEEESSF